MLDKQTAEQANLQLLNQLPVSRQLNESEQLLTAVDPSMLYGNQGGNK